MNAPAFPETKYRDGEYGRAIEYYDAEQADPYIESLRAEIDRLRKE
jgi:hypothetical protein